MIITDRCRDYLLNELKNNNMNTVEINISNNCCSPGLSFHLSYIYSNSNNVINGINVYYDKYYEKELENIILDYKNGMIFFE